MRITGKYFLLISILFSSPTRLIAQTITAKNADNVQLGQSLSVTITGLSTYFEQGSPTLTDINPDNAQQGESLAVAITGQNTNFLQGSGTLGVWFSQGSSTIYAAFYEAVANTLIFAGFDIPDDAPLGLWNVNVWSGMDGILTLFDGFTITAPSTLSGFVWMPDVPDIGYSLDEDCWLYFYSSVPVLDYNITKGEWDPVGPVGLIYVDWPFYYVFETNCLMFALPPESGLWIYHFCTGEWTVLPRILP